MVNEVCGPWQWDGSCNSAIISKTVRINKLRNSLRKKFPDSVGLTSYVTHCVKSFRIPYSK